MSTSCSGQSPLRPIREGGTRHQKDSCAPSKGTKNRDVPESKGAKNFHGFIAIAPRTISLPGLYETTCY